MSDVRTANRGPLRRIAAAGALACLVFVPLTASGCDESLASSLPPGAGDAQYASWEGESTAADAAAGAAVTRPADRWGDEDGPTRDHPVAGEPGDDTIPEDTIPEDTIPEDTIPAAEPDDERPRRDERSDAPAGEPGERAACPADVVCVTGLPFIHEGDTSAAPPGKLNGYSCALDSNEGGPEVLYRVDVPVDGFLSAAVYDGEGVDVDVHILASPEASSCVARGHHDASADVAAGTWWIAVDSWSDEAGVAQAGAYRVEIGLLAPSQGPCGVALGTMPRVGDGGDHLAMPATGPVVMEAHLVTQVEPPPFPATATDELQEHFALSQAVSGLVMHRDQVWAPLEGGSFYGAGIGSPSLFPVLDEAWYVNMYWTTSARPDRGTRMLIRIPGTDRAVVVAAGYETGPGNLGNIGGTTEETHFFLGTGHKSELTLGIATDQSLPLGPRRCTDVEPVPRAPTSGLPRYPAGQIHSPINGALVERWAAIASAAPDAAEDVFMKVGASTTVSSNFMKCFAGSHVDADLLSPAGQAARASFLTGDAGGQDPFSRSTLAAKSGMSAVWATAGSPSPIAMELAAGAARFAVVAYGANDMQLGISYESAIHGFADHLLQLVDELLAAGVVPVLATVTPRLDAAYAYRWVPTYNAVIRGVAQGRGIPLLDMHHIASALPGYGLSGDGLHMNVHTEGGASRACRFGEEALEHGYNSRNLATMEALARVHSVMIAGASAPDPAAPGLSGDGTVESPVIVAELPFVDIRNTAEAPSAELDVYEGCDSLADESGPEVLYRLDLTEPTRLRMMVFDQGAVDVDLHLLDETASEAGCVARDHNLLQLTLPAGTWHIAADSYVSGGVVKAGEFVLVIHECEADDPTCD